MKRKFLVLSITDEGFSEIVAQRRCAAPLVEQLLSQSSSFRRADPKQKKSIIKLQNKKIKWYFNTWFFLFVIQGVRLKYFK